ncbi:MAG TPA: SDR family oxidoreductase [Nevskiaceae bacterium]|nr:SDR family oxidoreductase [Nevskiaceae bacterium]
MSTIVVTGADRGIGEALCLAAARRGDRAIAACLDDAPALRAQGVRVEPGVDVTSDAAVAAFAGRLDGVAIDVLVHNAGLVIDRPLGSLDFDAMVREFQVNALGPLRVTQALLPMLKRGAKIGIVTSRVGSLGENGSGGLYGYRMSKAAANMAGLNLARDLAARGIAVICLHPGTVRTKMTQGLGDTRTMGTLVEPADAARGLLARIDELELSSTGTFRHANGETLPW